MHDEDFFRALPTVVLHEHLDGSLRPATMVEIAAEIGHQLPADDAESLGRWFYEAANSGSLTRYLTTFAHTTACMQRARDLVRVAREWVLDLAADGVVAGEARWAPEQHTAAGLSMDEAVEAVAEGLRQGMDEAARAGTPVIARQLLTAMRHADNGVAVAELVLRHRETDLVAGFDIAGGEAGNPPIRHIEAFRLLRRNGAYYTIHGGEEGELLSLRQAAFDCAAMRIGHGVKVVEDITRDADGTAHLGPLATFVRNQRIMMEVCPGSNVQTGAATSIAEHPIGRLLDLDFNVSINTDNRLLGNTTLSREYALVAEAFDIPAGQLAQIAVQAAQALFLDHDEKACLVSSITGAWQAAADRN